MTDDDIRNARFFLKDTVRMQIDFRLTDQNRGIDPPPAQKPYAADATVIELPGTESFPGDYTIPLAQALARRRSVRSFSDEALTLKELSFLLWATQGIRKTPGAAVTLRTVPSAGGRHAFETYLYVRLVQGLDEGIYRYLPLEHRLLLESAGGGMGPKISRACLDQRFTGESGVTFFWAAVPYRMEWRYSLAAHKVIAIDAGHVCQNLYLACEAISAGTCAVAAYDQEALDRLLGLDGENEFVVYLAPVGKTKTA